MFTSIAAFFALGAVGFYLFLGVLSVIFTVAVETDRKSGYFWAAFLTVLAAVTYHGQVLAFLLNWKIFALAFLIYGLIGGVWSVFRWFRYCRFLVLEKPYETRSTYEREEITPEKYYKSLLKPRDHKSQLTSWIVFWPWSLIWNCTGDFFTGIYESLANVYESIAAKVVAHAVKSVSPDAILSRKTAPRTEKNNDY